MVEGPGEINGVPYTLELTMAISGKLLQEELLVMRKLFDRYGCRAAISKVTCKC